METECLAEHQYDIEDKCRNQYVFEEPAEITDSLFPLNVVYLFPVGGQYQQTRTHVGEQGSGCRMDAHGVVGKIHYQAQQETEHEYRRIPQPVGQNIDGQDVNVDVYVRMKLYIIQYKKNFRLLIVRFPIVAFPVFWYAQ